MLPIIPVTLAVLIFAIYFADLQYDDAWSREQDHVAEAIAAYHQASMQHVPHMGGATGVAVDAPLHDRLGGMMAWRSEALSVSGNIQIVTWPTDFGASYDAEDLRRFEIRIAELARRDYGGFFEQDPALGPDFQGRVDGVRVATTSVPIPDGAPVLVGYR